MAVFFVALTAVLFLVIVLNRRCHSGLTQHSGHECENKHNTSEDKCITFLAYSHIQKHNGTRSEQGQLVLVWSYKPSAGAVLQKRPILSFKL